jgi:hypothetical protein
VGVLAGAALLFGALQAGTKAYAAVTASELNQNQAARDVLFKTLKATTAAEYKFDYMVIYLPPGFHQLRE